ncbi:sensor histidine kinase [Tessaracoccus antarcticus]|uniref:histidine kinase n=1 Tax=Tessaracoccus antarcticus TaxID=2479848 RepID=A0A3M0GCA4_9ACTN|nr:HAMP domain-containing sensor histidine kinase [Tessaracoccus antarcticus]RMB61988.1 sensor histidine kinase [Tessaracoccus antarcticus]
MTRSLTLSAQLRHRVTLIVAVLAIILSASTLLAARTMTYNQVDSQLEAAFTRQGRPGSPGDMAPGINVPGMAQGTIIVALMQNGEKRGTTVGDGSFRRVATDAGDALLAVPADGEKHTISVPGLGEYRAEARVDENRIVVALPLAEQNRTLLGLTVLTVSLGMLAVVVAAAATAALVSRATRPLRALGRTAHEVSNLRLDEGDVQVPAPVDAEGLPPDHEVAQLATAFNHMLMNVQGALAVRQASEIKLRRFVADASHELRNPLAAIQGYAELAERPEASADDVAHALKRIHSESLRMTTLVSDLLLLARLDAEPPVELRPVDIVETVLNAVSDAQVAGPGHVWRMNLPDEGFDVMANPGQLHQVVVNLLSNARNHTPEGTTVTTTVAMRQGRACLEVRDDGPGVPADVLPRVFERFTRADVARTHSDSRSTGLGLAIVHAVVRSFGGATQVESRPGNTCFTVWLRPAPSQIK